MYMYVECIHCIFVAFLSIYAKLFIAMIVFIGHERHWSTIYLQSNAQDAYAIMTIVLVSIECPTQLHKNLSSDRDYFIL